MINVNALCPDGTTKEARGPRDLPRVLVLGTGRIAVPDLTNAELVTLRIRVIALENSDDFLACKGLR